MPTPTGYSATKIATLSGNTLADALIDGTQWQSGSLTYSFPNATSTWSTDITTGYGPRGGQREPWLPGYAALSPAQQDSVNSALAAWSAVANVSFQLVADSAVGVGDLRFAFTSGTYAPDAQAFAYTPETAARAGDIWFSDDSSSNNGGAAWAPGTYQYLTVLHEIGHALGLKHPFEGEPGNALVIDPMYDSRSYTVMSYSAWQGDQDSYFNFEPTTPMLLDILAIQQLYGPNLGNNAGDTTYVFNDGTRYHQTIWDTGGHDTLVINVTNGADIDLRGGFNGSRLGGGVTVANRGYVVDNLWIAFGTVIEDVTGSNNVIGNDADNAITGSWGGVDHLQGGKGADTLIGGQYTDTLEGGDDADSLAGGPGHDALYGGDAADTLDGGPGDDTLDGGSGQDTLTGGDGSDSILYSLAASAVRIDLTANTVRDASGATVDVIAEIENATGSDFDDAITGTTDANRLVGGNGNDTLRGMGGGDTLSGGAGIDEVRFEVNAARFRISAASSSLLAMQDTGGTGNNPDSPQLDGIERLAFADRVYTLSNDGTHFTITGTATDDTIDIAGGGAITAIGGAGNDTYSVGEAGDVVIENPDEGDDTVRSLVSWQLGANLESLVLLEANTALNGTGNAAANHITGNAYANVLEGMDGDDTIDGGAGSDTASYAHASGAVNVDLARITGTQASGAAGNDVLTGIENLTGGAYDDVLSGNGEANTLQGGEGNDTLRGGSGSDFLDGGAGIDTARWASPSTHYRIGIDNAGALLIEDLGSATVDRLISVDRLEFTDAAFGVKNDAAIRVNDTAGLYSNYPSVAVLADGSFVVTWTEYSKNEMIFSVHAHRIDNDGNPVGSDIRVSTNAVWADSDTVVNALPDGGFVVTWSGVQTAQELTSHEFGYHVYARRFDQLGIAVSDETALSPLTIFGNQLDAIALADGSLAVVWRQFDYALFTSILMARHLDAGGNAIGDPITVFTGTLDTPSVAALASGGFVVSWTAGYEVGSGSPEIFARVYDGSNQPRTGAIRLNEFIEGQQSDGAIVGVPGGGFAAIWESTPNYAYATVQARYFDAIGAPLGDSINVTQTIPYPQTKPSLAVLDGGNMVATWHYDSSFHSQLLSPSGDLLGDPIIIDERDTYFLNSDIAATDRGALVATWSFYQGFETNNDIMVQLLDAQGRPQLTQIIGTDADDTIDVSGDGKLAAAGGAGNDDYVVAAGDQAIERPGEGEDTVSSLVSWTLGPDTEHLVLLDEGGAIDGTGNAGANRLTGNASENILEGGDGYDTIDGGAGIDTASYLHAPAGVSVDLAQEAQSNSGVGDDLLRNIEGAIGSAFADTLHGSIGSNILSGNAGDDTLDGLDGADTLAGGAGNDLLSGGDGDDTATYAAATAGVVVSLLLAGPQNTVGDGTDTLLSIENLIGSAFGDSLLGNASANILYGGPGADTLRGGGGDDLLFGDDGNDVLRSDAGNDTMAGGLGDDTYVVDSPTALLTELPDQGSDTIVTAFTVALRNHPNFENITLVDGGAADATGNDGNNILRGNSSANTLSGAAGNDALFGRADDDVLTGGDGDDTLDGGTGADTLQGGAGNDTYIIDNERDVIDESGSGPYDFADTVVATATYRLPVFDPGGPNIEYLTLDGGADIDGYGNAGPNLITGNAGNNRLEGGAGPDSLVGGDGADVLVGGDSDNRLLGDAGNDLLFGGSGTAWMLGGTGSDVLVSASGNDTGIGGAGNDYLYMGEGDDIAYGGWEYDFPVVDAGDVDVFVMGTGRDTVIGSAAHDYMYGGDGTDILLGKDGVDVLLGEAGNDVAYGGNGGDYFYLGDGDDRGEGDDGNDIFVDSVGNNTVIGGNGQDYFYMGAGNDSMEGGAGVDVMLGGAGNDTFFGGADVDYLFLGPGGPGDDDKVAVFAEQSGPQVVYGFEPGGTNDRIRLLGGHLYSFADVMAATTDFTAAGNFMVITLDADTNIWLIGVQPSQLTPDDFLFG